MTVWYDMKKDFLFTVTKKQIGIPVAGIVMHRDPLFMDWIYLVVL